MSDRDDLHVFGPVQFHGSWSDSLDRAVEDWEDDVERRDFLRRWTYTAAASSVPAFQWLVGEPEIISNGAGDFLIGAPHVEMIQEVTKAFRRLDNRFGGGHARESVMRFLTGDVVKLIRQGRYDRTTGAALMSAGAESLHLAGWMSYDSGLHGLGQRYMAQALRLAMACDDRSLGAEILAGLSHQAGYLGDGAAAVDLARAAGSTARQLGMEALVAEASVMEAHGHARTGDERACSRALSVAETVWDKADHGSAPQWIGYFDEAYLSAKFGHCFKELRRPGTAKTFARRSLTMDNSYVRGRAFNLTLLATVHAQAGEVEMACSVGTEAVGIIGNLNSVRAIEYLRALRRELAPYEDSPTVSKFDETMAASNIGI